MRRTSGILGTGRAAVLAAGIAIALAFAPAAAFAATPHSSLTLSTIYMAKARVLTVHGHIASNLHGKKMTVEIRKPGRTFWTSVASPTITSAGRWSVNYLPKLGGKFFVRARYGAYAAGVSRTATLVVRRGPSLKTTIFLASTTSTRDSGLMDLLKPAFLAACPEYGLAAQYVGSGNAMTLAGNGDADVLLVHSPTAELDFMKGIVSGKSVAHRGLTRHSVMYNDFVLVGPTSNPANVLVGDTAKEAFQKIATSGSKFISRNDASGTNAKELEIWDSIGNPQTGKSWYTLSGANTGMAIALANADQQGAYTLADRATWLVVHNLKTIPHLTLVNEGDKALFNQYSVIDVRGARNWEGAQDFSLWLRSPQAQSLIRGYGLETFGRALFVPNAGKY
jgi:tungstate transport system substrate-binding protein